MTRILHIGHGHEDYGVLRTLNNLRAGLASFDVPVHLVFLSDGPAVARYRSAGVRPHVVGCPPPPVITAASLAGRFTQAVLLLVHQVRTAWKLVPAVRRIGPSHLHVMWLNLLPCAVLAGLVTGTPVVWEMTNVITRPSSRHILRLVTRLGRVTVVANSRSTAGSLDPVDPPRIVHLSVDCDGCGSADRKGNSVPVLAVVARLTPEKGFEIILRGLAEVSKPVRLVVAGSEVVPGYRAYLEGLARELGIADHVTFIGHVPDVCEIYCAIDLLVSAPVRPESFGLSLAEAIMHGVPVLTHSAGGPADIIRHEETGWLFDGDLTVENFVRALSHALDSRAEWPAMGLHARADAQERFTTGQQARRFLEVVAG